MKYSQFKKECQKTTSGKVIYDMWMEGKLPLGWAIKWLRIMKKI